MNKSPHIRLMLGDTFRGMDSLPDQSIDLILTDPPYGITDCSWDNKPDIKELWRHWVRLLKPQGAVVLTATFRFGMEMVLGNPKWFRYDLVWEKTRAVGFLNAKKMPMRNHEMILVFYPRTGAYQALKVPSVVKKRSPTRNRSTSNTYAIRGPAAENFVWEDDGYRHPKSVLRFDSVAKPVHPTQKPLELFEWLVGSYSRPGACVLDPYMGSGTTALASARLNRCFIGFETLEKYFQIVQKRLVDLHSTLPIYTGPLGDICLN